jgi:hypothetical protein
MPQFSLKTLFLSVSLVAAGLVVVMLGIKEPFAGAAFLASSAGGSMIGGGIFAPFNKGEMGAFIGLLAPFVLLILLFLLTGP